jgi:FkbM family methyltransferase
MRIFGINIHRLTNDFLEKENPFLKIKSILKRRKKELIIFDVGAHVGESAKTLSKIFPGSQLFCFEPFVESFETLKINTKGIQNIQLNNFALSNLRGKNQFYINQLSATNSFFAFHEKNSEYWENNILKTLSTIEVPTTTLDDFILENSIEAIDLIKIDTQGSELLVLQGGIAAFRDKKVGLVYLEVILSDTYSNESNFTNLLGFLFDYGFEIVQIYNPSYSKKGILRQVDILFQLKKI